MNRQVHAIAGRLSLRQPQRRSLKIIRSEFSSVTDFERDFPSVCFALATGVGKTWLMGAFISHQHLAL
jgi:type III restriction enzyme